MTTLAFNTSELADAVTKAARVAPTKGAAHDRSPGILFEIRPMQMNPVTLKATNIEVTYLQKVDGTVQDGEDDVDWRLPSGLLAGIVGNLPSNETVTLREKDKGHVEIKCGKARAKIARYADDAPFVQWEPFDPAMLSNVTAFATRVAQVAWACDEKAIPFTGVHITGAHLIATDRYRLVQVPCDVPIDKPITVPLDILAPILREFGDAGLRATDRRLQIGSGNTQITSVIFDSEFPAVSFVMKKPDEYPNTVSVECEAVLSAIRRMLVLVRGERYPVMCLTIGEGVVRIFMDVPDVGEMEDELLVDADHAPFEVYFTPNNFVEAFANAGATTVSFSYDPSNAKRQVLVSDGDSYLCWVMPRWMDGNKPPTTAIAKKAEAEPEEEPVSV